MSLEFNKISSYERGKLLELLTDAYSFDLSYEQNCKSDWIAFDDFFFDNPHIAETCGFITTLNNEAIGFVTWDPRNMPDYVAIGHNCIASKFKGNGYGIMQLQEAVNRISQSNVKKIIVTTDTGLRPARRMYERVGFRLDLERPRKEEWHINYTYSL